MKNDVIIEKGNFISFTQADLRQLGLNEVGYIKRYEMRGKPAYVLHAADGTAISVQDNADAAGVSALHQEIDLVSVH